MLLSGHVVSSVSLLQRMRTAVTSSVGSLRLVWVRNNPRYEPESALLCLICFTDARLCRVMCVWFLSSRSCVCVCVCYAARLICVFLLFKASEDEDVALVCVWSVAVCVWRVTMFLWWRAASVTLMFLPRRSSLISLSLISFSLSLCLSVITCVCLCWSRHFPALIMDVKCVSLESC